MPDSEIIIDVEGIVKRFGPKTAVNGIALQVRKGEIFGFLGPNGSGKTTTIRMICGLLVPDGGKGTCLGYDILRQSAQIKRNVGYMAQHFSLYGDLTVRENLDFISRLYQIENRKAAVEQTIERLELGRFRNQLAGTLSGGWKQRLALGCCMIHNPKVLLLDEPTAGVDPKGRREFWDQVNLLASEGISSLISTHYMDEAVRCNRIAYIAYGNLLTAGTAEEVIQREGLTTWAVTGGDPMAMQKRLAGLPGVEQVAAFGNTLHVIGKDAALMSGSIQPFFEAPYEWNRVETSLEEVFMSLMARAEVN